MRDAPRTDLIMGWAWQVTSPSCREEMRQAILNLESELAAANKRIADLESALDAATHGKYSELMLDLAKGVAGQLADSLQVNALKAELAAANQRADMLQPEKRILVKQRDLNAKRADAAELLAKMRPRPIDVDDLKEQFAAANKRADEAELNAKRWK